MRFYGAKNSFSIGIIRYDVEYSDGLPPPGLTGVVVVSAVAFVLVCMVVPFSTAGFVSPLEPA